VYTRRPGRLVNGVARVALGETFALVANPDLGLTVHITPRGETPLPLAAAVVSTSELLVRPSSKLAVESLRARMGPAYTPILLGGTSMASRRSSIAILALAAWVLATWLSSVALADADTKVKTNGGTTITRDKSKPLRKALEEWYARNTAAFEARDVEAIMALRTDDFHTLTLDGRVNTRADMEARTRMFVDRIEEWISQRFEIGTIDVDGDLASADVNQHTVRMQRFPDKTVRKVEASVVQRETWRETPEGWKLLRVDNIRDGALLVDDKPYPER
jgi:ketosteroid isomerase-like protein